MNEWGEEPRPPFPARFDDLAGTSVFITGGGSGIGAALTDAFLGQGARVAFVQRSDATGFCAAMKDRHGRAPLFLPCDITDVTALKAAIDQAAAAHGTVDVLINNAANDQRHATEEVTEDYWKWSIDINLKAYFFACQAVVGPMRAKGGGAIINFSSIAYMMGMPGLPLYTSSNAAIVSLTQTFAREFGADGIRVNAIAPGMIVTERQKKLWLTPEGVRDHVAKQSLKKTLVGEDLAGPALFLASGASAAMTGQTLIVDGGFVARP